MKPSAFLKMGPMQAAFENGGLRAITYGGTEIVRGLYAAVRDRNWGTVEPRLSDVRSTKSTDEWTLRFVSRHVQGDIDFEWSGFIAMRPDRLRFDFDGVARTSFLKNRIGFCLLHPMTFAGLPAVVRTEGGLVHGAFPGAISPNQPYKAMQGIEFEPLPGLRVDTTFNGDLFEMEDQRNWTDASFKTYCTPLDLPFPVRMEAGQRLTQSVIIEVAQTETGSDGGSANDRPRGIRAGIGKQVQDAAVRINADRAAVCRLPDIGLAMAEEVPDEASAALLEQLRPAHLHVSLDLGEDGWRASLRSAAAAAARYECGLTLELLLDGGKERLSELVRLIAGDGTGQPMPVLRILPYASGTFTTDAAALQRVREALANAGLSLPVGGGTRAYYAEFNRAALPLQEMELAVYTINPQVHAFDDRSLMETPAAQRETAIDAAAKSGKPLYIGPITFKPRLNPNATSGGGAIPLSERTDPRQHGAFGAAWTLASVSALCAPQVRALTYFETSGPLGLVCGGKASPLYFLLRDLMRMPGADVLSVGRSSEDVAVLALRTIDGRLRLLLSNTTAAPRAVEIDAGDSYAFRSEVSYDSNDVASTGSRASATVEAIKEQRPEVTVDRRVSRILAPYACICVDFEKSRDIDT
ncbi:hypothetical protein [Cohnella hashimotonis]|uniref:Uncharacterized protein n=1 Tax=Cohnella hashimotonis TaxID=2826895 RepID=A0ABT6TFT2_9BACL|nr:hypothetical protein [Cohnella hashimotonis]MDI4644697.1 hypothetical protein [Cohnella hashimotonis]